jgi:hypothetical protein
MLVRPKSWRLGMITDQSETSVLKANVKVFYFSQFMEPISMKIINLSHAQDDIDAMTNPVASRFDMKNVTGV